MREKIKEPEVRRIAPAEAGELRPSMPGSTQEPRPHRAGYDGPRGGVSLVRPAGVLARRDILKGRLVDSRPFLRHYRRVGSRWTYRHTCSG